MNLHHLEIFRCVFETVSMTAAAERLMISQPAVSKQIKELERSLGIPLFVRQTRALTPTPAGHLLAKYARNVNDVVEQAKEAIAALKKGERGRLSLAASTTIGTYIVPRILELFHRDYPDVEISLEVVNTAAAHQLLLDGAVELALTEGFVDRTKLNAEVFERDELVVIASPLHKLAQQKIVTADQVSQTRLIWREQGSGTRDVILETLHRLHLDTIEKIVVSSTETIKHLVADNVGIAILSRLAVTNELNSGKLIELNVRGLQVIRPLHLARVPGRPKTLAAEAFIELLSRHRPQNEEFTI